MRNLAARAGMFAKSGGGWPNPYVTDGLVAMWDGEWNTGVGGVHSSSASVWIDLIGKYVATPSSGASALTWGTNYVSQTSNGMDIDLSVGNTILSSFRNGVGTIEGTFSSDDPRPNVEFIAAYKQGGTYTSENGYLMNAGCNNNINLNFYVGVLSNFGISANTFGTTFTYFLRPTWFSANCQNFSATVEAYNSYYHWPETAGAFINVEAQLSKFCIGPREELVGRKALKINNIRFYNRSLTAAEENSNKLVDMERFGVGT